MYAWSGEGRAPCGGPAFAYPGSFTDSLTYTLLGGTPTAAAAGAAISLLTLPDCNASSVAAVCAPAQAGGEVAC